VEVTETLQLFFSLLAVLCQVFVVVVVGLKLSSFSQKLRPAWTATRDFIAPYAVLMAFLVATVTTLGSLYMSEIAGYLPCKLCWVQRGFIYPQVLLTALLWSRPALRWLRSLSIFVALTGAIVSIYHYLIEWNVVGESSCDPNNPCSAIWFRELGYITLPLMALTAALTIVTLLVMSWPNRRKSGE
jgi:disulfide bond formation protein DsbB